MTKQTKELATIPQELIDAVKNNTPTQDSFQRIMLPRIGMYSQDKTEGKGKSMTVVAEAGMFYIEKETDELNDEGKKIWAKEEIGTSIEATILYNRKKLSMYDMDTEKYTSSPVYDEDTDMIPLFCDKKEINKGLPKDLKALYKFTAEDGKVKSKLQDNKILYVLYKDELYELSIKSTSMFSYMAYTRSVTPSLVLTTISSEPQQKGSTEWNMMTFKTIRPLDVEELTHVLDLQNGIKAGIKAEKDYFASMNIDAPTASTSIETEDWSPDLPKVEVKGIDGAKF